MLLYTIGIQGYEIASFLDQLNSAHVSLLLDVRRQQASGGRVEFSPLALRKYLSNAGISYVYFLMAGCRRTSAGCLYDYQNYLQANRSLLWDLLGRIRRASERGQTACLTCTKRVSAECHRSILADALMKLAPMLTVIDLPVPHGYPSVHSIGTAAVLTR